LALGHAAQIEGFFVWNTQTRGLPHMRDEKHGLSYTAVWHEHFENVSSQNSHQMLLRTLPK
jgi:hypothetical protein